MFRPGQPYGDRPAPRPELAPEIVQDLRMLIRSTPEAMEVGWNQQSLFRDDEVAQLAEIIDKPGSVLIISGPKRLGKSCEMKQLL